MLLIYGVYAFASSLLLFILIIKAFRVLPIEYHAYLIYTLFLGTLSGAIFAPFFIDYSPRFQYITESTAIFISLATSYYIFILSLFLLLNKERKHELLIYPQVKEQIVASILLWSSVIYLVLRLFLFYKETPLMAALNGDLLQAARLRQSIQLKENAVDIPYIGAVFKSFSVVCVYYYFIEFMKTNRRKGYFIISFFSCALCLTLDLQKAPVFLVFINLFFIYIYYKKINIKALFFLFFVLFLLTVSVVFITGSDNPIDSLISIFDRVLFGQNQAMYYMLQYLSPDVNGFLYNFYFSSLTDTNSVPPNMKVIEFIPYYFGNDTLVNVNTFIVGDAWAFFGMPGVILSPFLVAFIFFVQSWFFSYLKRYSYFIFTSLAISFFSFYPINRSLAEILTLKYFLHYLSFSVIPIIIVLGIVNLLAVKK